MTPDSLFLLTQQSVDCFQMVFSRFSSYNPKAFSATLVDFYCNDFAFALHSVVLVVFLRHKYKQKNKTKMKSPHKIRPERPPQVDGVFWLPYRHFLFSNTGQIFSLKTGSLIKGKRMKLGYITVSTLVDDKVLIEYVHRIVAKIFLGNPENKREVNHKDGDKANNKVENLEWVTSSENKYHAFATGLRSVGRRGENHNAIPVKVLKNGVIVAKFSCIKDCSDFFGGITHSWCATILRDNRTCKGLTIEKL